MSTFDLMMPKLGESIEEATITKWFKKVNDTVEEDDPILEIATDKVDSEIPSPVAGVIKEILFKEGDLVAVGKVIAVIDLSGEGAATTDKETETKAEPAKTDKPEEKSEEKKTTPPTGNLPAQSEATRFYSPLVKSIASKEGIPIEELEQITGTGQEGRVRKEDVLEYIKSGRKSKASSAAATEKPASKAEVSRAPVSVGAGDEIVEMDRMRRLIADHMVMSKQVSPHVTNMVEADATNLVKWREKVKDEFLSREKEKITFLPVILEATARALKDFPGVNASVDGYNIILRKRVNLGVAVSLPTGNLIVPVIKDADQKNLLGLTKDLNRLASEARNNKLSPDDIQGGTFTITNFGSFRNVMGTPIINQPQVAILAVGTIEKKPAVLETPQGDVIAIRHKMFLSLTYDHRVVDGALGGAFLRRVADYIEDFDVDRTI